MAHLYPIASNADDALNNADMAARTRYEAEALADGLEILKLETEWVTPASDDIIAVMDAADAGPGQGFVQRYENESGDPILAITYWKLGTAKAKPRTEKPAPTSVEEDHTDDLYFRHGRTKPAKKRGRKKFIDPRQMDMFTAPSSDEEDAT